MKAISTIVACAVLGHQAAAAPIDDFNMDDLELFDMMAAPTPMMTDMPMPEPVPVPVSIQPGMTSGGLIPIVGGQGPPGAAPPVPNVGSAPPGAPPQGKPAIGATVGQSILCPQGCGVFSVCGERGCQCVNANYEFIDKNNPNGGCRLKPPPKLQQKSSGKCLDYSLNLVDCGGAPSFSYVMGTLRTTENPPRCVGLRNDNDSGVILAPCNGKNQDWVSNDGMYILGGTQCLTFSSSLYAGSCYGTDDQRWILGSK
eukprot:comp22314_c0_seq1/m.33152 comp22314_c0_seq1/g.33152  ORF comp22314_c0_seq1/g.33152 comp22314_c0_seq1/m.33152 type:complete len:256 (-) comp22314_c0_seq1:697-1464(-)